MIEELQGNFWVGDGTSLAALNKPFWAKVTSAADANNFYAWEEYIPFPYGSAGSPGTFTLQEGMRSGTVSRNPLYCANTFPITLDSYVLIRRGYFDTTLDWVYVIVEYTNPTQTFNNITVNNSFTIGGVNITVVSGVTYFVTNNTTIINPAGPIVWGDPVNASLVTNVCITKLTDSGTLTSNDDVAITTTTPTDLLEVTVTVEKATNVLIDTAIVWSTLGGGTALDVFYGRLLVDGVDTGSDSPVSKRHVMTVGNASWTQNTSYPFLVYLTAGSHTLKLQGYRAQGTGNNNVVAADIVVVGEAVLSVQRQKFTLPNSTTNLGPFCEEDPAECCPDDPGPPSGGGDCAITCGDCTMPFTVSLVISGVTDGSCTDCELLNGTHVLVFDSAYPLNTADTCGTWYKTIADAGCGAGWDIQLWYSISEAKWKLSYPRGANLATVVEFSSWNCGGVNTVVDSSENSYCGGPVTLEVTVPECGAGGPCSGHPTCLFCTGVAPTSWALTLSGFTGGFIDVNGDWTLTQALPLQKDLPFGCEWCQTKTIEGPDGEDYEVEVCIGADVGPDAVGGLVLSVNNDAYFVLYTTGPIDCCADQEFGLEQKGSYTAAPLKVTATPTCEECPGVETLCCPDDEVPTVLYLTLSNATGDCACMDGLTIPIFYDEEEDTWSNSVSTCGQTLSPVLSCLGGGTWNLAAALPCFFVDAGAPDSVSCGPTEMQWDAVTVGGCCSGTVQINLTETAP